tara:strand:- start:708 stop:953 length:246 start_codon:yes stop_codon:yes gene_type:complete
MKNNILTGILIVGIIFLMSCTTPPTGNEGSMEQTTTTTVASSDSSVDDLGNELDDLTTTEGDLDIGDLDGLDSTLQDIENI